MLDSLYECCTTAFAAIDGDYGWFPEALSLFVFVLLFNFILRGLLTKIQARLSSQGRIWQESFLGALYKPLSTYVWFFAIVQGSGIIAERVLGYTYPQFRHFILGLGAVFAITWFFYRWKIRVVELLTQLSKKHEITFDLTKIDVVDKMMTLFIIFFFILLLLEVSGISLNILLAFSGIGGLALAFASQELIANFFAGAMIYTTHPFSRGEWIQIPEKNIEGIVDEIGWYMTRLISLDKKPLYVPNAIFSKAVVINPSRMNYREFKEIFSIQYPDLSTLQCITDSCRLFLTHHPLIVTSSGIQIEIKAIGSKGADIQLKAYTSAIQSDAYATFRSDLMVKIAELVEQTGGAIPTPWSNFHYLHEKE